MGGGDHTKAKAAVRGLLVGLIYHVSPGDPVWVVRLGGISEPSCQAHITPSYLEVSYTHPEVSQKLGSLDTLSC